MDLTFPDLVQHFGPSAGVIAVLGYAVRQLMNWYNQSTERAEAGRREFQIATEKAHRETIDTFKASIIEIRSAYEKKQEIMDQRLVERQEQIRQLEIQNQRDRADYQSRSLAIEKEHSAVMNKISGNMEKLAAKIDHIGAQMARCNK